MEAVAETVRWALLPVTLTIIVVIVIPCALLAAAFDYLEHH
jgi:hypothetical protein